MEEVYRSFYTKSNFITEYMVKMIGVKDGDRILEPSAGDGVFIDKVLDINKNVNICAYDLNPEAIGKLYAKYSENRNIRIIESDTLMDEELDKYSLEGGIYDKVIGNPPYGGWLGKEQREVLKKKFNIYSKETYSLFLLRCISLLKENGVLSFIIPDTYLFLHRHKDLRKYLLLNTRIKEILIFPSKFFPGVNFGYSNISIITLQKSEKQENLDNIINIITGLKSSKVIEDITNCKLEEVNIAKISQNEVFKSIDSTFFINSDNICRDIINNSQNTLSDIADCVTGIYTGDNSSFMKVRDITVKNSKGYSIIEKDEIYNYEDIKSNALDGVNSEIAYLPIVKGASSMKYLRFTDDWYIDWSKDTIVKYKTFKKARFQNSQFYFKKGIAIPMVKSSKISATLMDKRVFDQSIVGVFPKKEKYLYYLLALCNSNTFRDIIQIINPTANNSANYIKKVPIIIPSDIELSKIEEKVKFLINDLKSNVKLNEELQEELNDYFATLYGF